MEYAICRWVPDLSSTGVELLRKEGVTAIEPGPSFLLDRDEMVLNLEKERLDKAGIRIYSCHAPFNGENDLSSLNEDERQGAVTTHMKALVRASFVGAECMVIHPSGEILPAEREQRIRQLYISLEALIQKAEEAGVRLALENMLPKHIGCEAALIRRVVDDLDTKFLGICLDTGHAHLNNGGVSGAFDVFREKIITFHLQDNDGNSDRHLQPPYGTINWEALAPALIALEFKKPMAVEAPPWRGTSLDTLLREVHSLFEIGLLEIDLETPSRESCRAHVVCKKCGRYCFGTSHEWFCGCNPPPLRT